MASDPTDQTAQQRRATWVGLRTLRQRPKLVGETTGGDAVFEVKSVPLVLRDDAGHFSRLVQCSRCGRDVPGAAVLSPADLDRPAHPVICKECVRASVGSRALQPAGRPTRPASAPDHDKPDVPPAEPVDDVRLAALEDHLEAALARLAQLAEGQEEGLATVRAEVAAANEASTARLTAIEGHVRQAAEAMAREAMAALRAEMMAASEASEARLAAVEGRVGAPSTGSSDEALAALRTEMAATNDATAGRLGAIERALQQAAESAVTEAMAAFRAEVAAALEASTARIVALEQHARQTAESVSQLAEVQRGEFLAVSATLAETRTEVQGLAEGRPETAAPTAGTNGAGRLEARLDALATAVDEGAHRQRAFELRTQQAIDRLTGVVETLRRELRPAAPARRPSTRDARLHKGVGQGDPGRALGGELLDGLEHQLKEAEGRLARLTAGSDDGGRRPAPPA